MRIRTLLEIGDEAVGKVGGKVRWFLLEFLVDPVGEIVFWCKSGLD